MLYCSPPQVEAEASDSHGEAQGGRDEYLIARLDMADYKFSFHEKAREYNPAWMSPEGRTTFTNLRL